MKEDKEYQIFINRFKRVFRPQKDNIVFLCIGSSSIIGDSFGPMVGSKLMKLKLKKNIKVIGNMERPIYANNIKENVTKIDKDSYIVAIDSALSEFVQEGIYVSSKKMILGAGVNKKIVEIGDISIKGCVGRKNDNLYSLNNVPESKILELANIVSKGISEVLKI